MRRFLLCCLLCAAALAAHAFTATGTVIDQENHPVVRARVEFGGNIPPVFTDDQGKFTAQFDLLPDNAYTNTSLSVVVISAPGYGLEGGYIYNGIPTVFRLTKPVALHGAVVDGTGHPIAGAHVMLQGFSWKSISIFPADIEARYNINLANLELPSFDDLPSWIPDNLAARYTAETDTQGKFSLPGMSDNVNVILVNVTKPGFAQGTGSLSRATEETSENTITLTAGATVHGRVLGTGGIPLANIRVTAIRNGPSVLTDSKGYFTFSHLSTHYRMLTLEDPTRQWLNLNDPATLMLKDGETSTIKPITMRRAGMITGMVMDEQGKPLSGVCIDMRREDVDDHRVFNGIDDGREYQFTMDAISQPGGRFSAAVVPGKYLVTVNPSTNGVMADRLKEGHVSVKAGQNAECTLRCTMNPRLAGMVTDEQGTPVVGLTLFIHDMQQKQDDPLCSITDAQGCFTAPPVSSCEIMFSTAHSLGAATSWAVISPKPGSVDTDNPITVVVRRNPRSRVVTRNGEPLAGAVVSLMWEYTPQNRKKDEPSHQVESTVVTDTLGSYELPEYIPTAKIALLDVKYNNMRCATAGSMVTTDGYAISDTTMVPYSITLHGTVVDAQGQPVAGAEVMSPEAKTVQRVTTDASGQFTLRNLPDARVTLIAATSTAAVTLSVTPDGNPVTVTLRPVTPVKPHDVQRLAALLRADWQRPKDQRLFNHVGVIERIAQYDYQLACALAQEEGIPVPDKALIAYLTQLLHRDLHQAALLGPGIVARIQQPSARWDAAVLLGKAMAGHNRQLAEDCYALLKKLQRLPTLRDDPCLDIDLIQLAIKLHHPDVPALITATMARCRECDRRDESNDTIAYFYLRLVLMDPVQAERLWARMTSVERDWIENEIDLIAKDTPSQARYLLTYCNTKHHTQLKSDTLACTLELIDLQQLATVDPERALQRIRNRTPNYYEYDDAMNAFFTGAAQCRDGARVLRAMQAVPQMTKQRGHFEIDTDEVAALLAYRIDPVYATAQFAEIRQVWAEITRRTEALTSDRILRSGDWGDFAYLYSRIDPLDSRMLMEASFSHFTNRIHVDGNDIDGVRISAEGMVAIDPERAVEMISQLGKTSHIYRSSAISNLVNYLLADDMERILRKFH